MTFATTSATPLASQTLADRKAQYAAWKNRIMNGGDDEVVVVSDPRPSKWSFEALMAGLPVD